jgi:hypothetical protein
MMGELTFFLGIQVKQTKEGIFIHQAKYMKDLMKKFNMAKLKPVSTPMSTTAVLDPDENGEVVDQREYKSMIGSLLYLTAIQSDIQFTMCLCARFQASPRSSHRMTVQWIFRYLKYTHGFFDVDFVGCGIDWKSTSGTCHFLGSSLVCLSAHKQSSVAQSTTEAEYVVATLRYFG